MGFPSVLTMARRWVAERAGPGAIAVDATAGGGVDTLFLARTAGPGGLVYAFDVQQAALARTRERLDAAAAATGEADTRRRPGPDGRTDAPGGTSFAGRPSAPAGTADRLAGRTVGTAGEASAAAAANEPDGPERGGPSGSGLARAVLLHAGHERMAELVAPEHRGRVRAVMFNLGYLPGEGSDRAVITRPETTLAALDAALELLAPRGAMTVVVYSGHDGGEREAAAVDEWAAALPAEAAQAVLYRFPQKSASPYLLALEKK